MIATGKSRIEFRYDIPSIAMRNDNSNTVRAWTTRCPGLILQEQNGDNKRFVLVHQNSGFIVKYLIYKEEGFLLAAVLSGLPLNWKVKHGWQVHQQLRNLDDVALLIFSVFILGVPAKDLEEFRTKVSIYADEKKFNKYVRGRKSR